MQRLFSALLCLVGVATAASAQQSSGTYTQVVNQTSPTVAVSSSVNPSTYTQSVVFTATVSADATGTVSFAADGSSFGTATISNGTASAGTAALLAGTHNVIASYSGDSNYLAGSASLAQVVNKATLGQGGVQAAVLASSPNHSTFGQTVALVVSLPANATGTVQFLDGSNPLGSSSASGGSADLGVASLSGGSHALTAVYSGDANYLGSSTNTVTQIVQPAASTTTLTASANPIPYSQALTLTAAVPAGATGTVQFFDGSTSLGTATITAASASITTTSLTAGQHSLTAVYSGDGNFSSSTSAPLTETVTLAGTVAQITATPVAAVVGTSISFTSLISTGGTLPTGGVTFFDGATQLASGAVTQVNTTNVLPWSNDFTKWTPSGSSVPTLTPASANGPDGSANTATVVTFPATTGGTTSNLTYNVSIGTYAAQPMAASVWVQSASAASLTLAITDNSGNTTTAPCTAGPTWSRCAVNAAFGAGAGTGFTLTLSAASQPAASVVAWGAQVEQASTVGPYVATSGASAGGSGLLATYATSALAVGVHNVTAQYADDSNFTASTSSPVQLTITQATSSVTVTSSGSPSVFGTSVTFTATATGPDSQPTGTVTFLSDGQTIGTGVLSNGTASISVSTLTVGSHAITVQYGGDTNNLAATSPAITQVVGKAPVHIAVSSSSNPSTYGQSVTLTIIISSPLATPTGSLTVIDSSGTLLGTLTLDGSGKATLTTSTLKAGSHNLSIAYGGDANFIEGSASYTQLVTPVATSLALASSSNPTQSGQTITFTATVAPISATGTIAFTIKSADGTILATFPRSVLVGGNGSAQISEAFPSSGTYVVTAAYSGDNNDQPSNSAPLNQVVIAVGDTSTPDFTLSAAAPSGTVSPGTSFGSLINLQSVNGFTGTVKLACSGTMDATMACNLAEQQLQLTAGATSTMLHVTTAGVTVTTVGAITLPWFLGLLLPGMCKRRRIATLGLVLGLGVAMLSIGCGTKNRYIQSNGTPPGTYTAVVTGTSGSIAHTAEVTVIVK